MSKQNTEQTGQKNDQVTQMQKNLISAQWAFDAAIKSFEAAAVVNNHEEVQNKAQECHEKLDVFLDCKRRAFYEYINPSSVMNS